ncbi:MULTISPECIES: hypothetical protein [unclassified Treponema]|uniref:hypothetical protein n=1 Tax=unclassified Treponema TaxID=2638727 RepID=UPI0020A3B9F3|nr:MULTISPECIES: hypothetical protein [unclassified Treponema]UTC66283.1 hypothetical protein E4O06_09880 [Treponema sp. OMZ 789]UTC69013.1 hypothetical protein E4O01_10030 [Treponema sp. OMZ 790]UTC71725.1 hypothetical protein E4O02_10120 [Treponema sp. OMZ 791]
MKRNKYTALLLIIIFNITVINTNIFAADKKKPNPPSKNEVVIVFSLKVQPSPDTDFFANYSHMVFSKMEIGHYHSTTDKITLSGSNRRMPLTVVFEEDAKLIDLAMVKFPFAYGKRYINIERLRYHFAGSEAICISIPLNSKIEVPEGVKYVYIGDFICKCSIPFYDITDIKRVDNFDAAAKAVKSVYGEDAELERLPLIPLEKK